MRLLNVEKKMRLLNVAYLLLDCLGKCMFTRFALSLTVALMPAIHASGFLPNRARYSKPRLLSLRYSPTDMESITGDEKKERNKLVLAKRKNGSETKVYMKGYIKKQINE